MSKLYPPVIEGTIPAFAGDIIRVPFQMNKAVGLNQISGFDLKIKTVQSNRLLGNLKSSSYDEMNNIVTFQCTFTDKVTLYPGQYYKIQMAYVDTSGVIGYYSTVGVIKYTTVPNIGISEETDGSTYVGYYSQEGGDLTEKVYSYRFDLTDSNGNIVETTGDQIHNNSLDDSLYESSDIFTLSSELSANIAYYLTYSVKTINGYEASSASKKIFQSESVDSKLEANVKAELNYENGYIDVSLTKPEGVDVEKVATGSFILLRASDKDNYGSWNEVLRFVLYGQTPSRKLWKDMTVEQGVSYKYAIQQYNAYGLRSNKIYSNVVKVDFEHIFLFDGERQLKVAYNPKVSSFKKTVLESKVDTIGSKYPYIFRNGNVGYKEFPISGLISLLTDENELFFGNDFEEITNDRENLQGIYTKVSSKISYEQYNNYYDTYYVVPDKEWLDKNGKAFIREGIKYYSFWFIPFSKWYKEQGKSNDWITIQSTLNTLITKGYLFEDTQHQKRKNLSLNNQKTTNLTAENYYNERNFKLEVLNWLTNGEPKLFRSPAEGNYLVRLLNTSLSPEDTLGRMLHTFSCTAYEIGEASYKVLEDYGIITTEAPSTKQLKLESVDLTTAANNVNLLRYSATSIRVEGMAPGDKFIVNNGDNNISVVIGPTGSYNIEPRNDIEISSFHLIGSEGIQHSGILTYSYYNNKFTDSFDDINTIEFIQIPCHQFIGRHGNIVNEINNIKYQLQSIGRLRFWLRNSDQTLYTIAEAETAHYYTDKACTNEVDLNNLSTTDIYLIYSIDTSGTTKSYPDTVYDVYNSYPITVDGITDDGNNLIGIKPSETSTQFKINGEVFELNDKPHYEFDGVDNITSIETGDAVVCELVYQLKEIQYDVENGTELQKLWDNYTKAVTQLKELWKTGTLAEIRKQEKVCHEAYQIYIGHLEEALAEKEGIDE